jgi:hypothetical protein
VEVVIAMRQIQFLWIAFLRTEQGGAGIDLIRVGQKNGEVLSFQFQNCHELEYSLAVLKKAHVLDSRELLILGLGVEVYRVNNWCCKARRRKRP